jgi:general secretion pathway protein K
MKAKLKNIWRFLMTPVGRRIPVRNGKGAPHGIALLVVMLSLALLSAVVTDMGSNEMVRYRLAVNDRDALKAQALAESSTNLSRLLLAMQAAVQPLITQLASTGIPLPAHTFWQLVPLDSELLTGLTSGELQASLGLDVSKSIEERRAKLEEKREAKKQEWDPDKEGHEGREPFEPPEGGFGYFDGTFKADIEDEEHKAAALRGWATAVGTDACFAKAQRLFDVLQPERYDFLFEDRDAQGNRTDRYDLVANLYDWIDENQEITDGRADKAQWCRGGTGSEDAVYSSGYKVEPKNAYFDSPGELRLVRGMTDAHLRAFLDKISIYAEGKINILSAPLSTIETLIITCAQPGDPLVQNQIWMDETLQGWEQSKTLGVLGGGFPPTPDGFLSYLDTRGLVVNPTCKDQMGTESQVFTISASATVGEVTRTMTTVERVVRQNEELYYYSIR